MQPSTRFLLSHATTLVLALVLLDSGFSQSKDRFRQLRMQMVEDAVIKAGVTDARVIKAMRMTPRHEFVPSKIRSQAYLDAGLPIGEQQTISSPFIVAYMTESLDPQKSDRVLEIGTGSGYQAAVLSPLVDEVYSIEIVEPLGEKGCRNTETAEVQECFHESG